MNPGSDTITRRRAALVDDARYGGKRRDWSGAATFDVGGVSVQAIGGDEATTDREYAATHMRVFAPASTDIATTDRIEWRGDEYDVTEVRREYDEDGSIDHVRFDIERSTG